MEKKKYVKGKFKRLLTNELLEECKNEFGNRKIIWEYKAGGRVFVLTSSSSGKIYYYYPSSDRWAPKCKKGFPEKHYRAKDLYDFLDRFFDKIPTKNEN